MTNMNRFELQIVLEQIGKGCEVGEQHWVQISVKFATGGKKVHSLKLLDFLHYVAIFAKEGGFLVSTAQCIHGDGDVQIFIITHISTSFILIRG